MENKNFEKINAYEKGCSYAFADGHNTCLDRTNAKGIYEVDLKILKHYEEEPMAISYKYDSEYRMDFAKWMASLRVLFNELQTELKKAE